MSHKSFIMASTKRPGRMVKFAAIASAVSAVLVAGMRTSHAATIYFIGANTDGTANTNFDDAATDTNFNVNDTGTNDTNTNYTDGDAVIFSDLHGGTGNGVVVKPNLTTTVGSTGPAPASVTFEADGGTAATANYSFTNGTATTGISGSGSVTLAAGFEGEVIFNSANSYTGGTYINGGTLHGGTGSFASTNTFYLGGGTLQTSSGSGGTYAAGQNFIATPGTSSAIQATSASNNIIINGTISSGAGATADGTVLSFLGGETASLGQLSGFTGTFELGSFEAGTVRLDYSGAAATAGSGTAIFDLGASTATLEAYNGGGSGTGAFANAIPLGALEGSGTGSFVAGASHSGSTFYAIGGLGLTTTYNGTIKNGAQPLGLYIVGGALTVTGNNTYTLGTTIQSGGSFFADNATSSAGTGAVSVISSGVLGGNGVVSGAITVNSATAPPSAFSTGGHIAPGSAGATAGSTVGTLSLPGGLTLNDYSNLDFTLNGDSTASGNDLIATSDLTLPASGLVQVNFQLTGGTPASGSTYDLISYTGTLANPASVDTWTFTGLPAGDTATFSTSTAGEITATISGGVPTPEPTTLGIVGIALGSLLVRRRRCRNA